MRHNMQVCLLKYYVRKALWRLVLGPRRRSNSEHGSTPKRKISLLEFRLYND